MGEIDYLESIGILIEGKIKWSEIVRKERVSPHLVGKICRDLMGRGILSTVEKDSYVLETKSGIRMNPAGVGSLLFFYFDQREYAESYKEALGNVQTFIRGPL